MGQVSQTAHASGEVVRNRRRGIQYGETRTEGWGSTKLLLQSMNRSLHRRGWGILGNHDWARGQRGVAGCRRASRTRQASL